MLAKPCGDVQVGAVVLKDPDKGVDFAAALHT